MLCKNGNICNKVTIFSHDFFPACTLALYDDVKCQDTNRDKLSNNLYCSHLQILYAHIQNQGVSPWIPHTRVWVILEEHDVEWSNPMSSKIRREKTVVEKGRKNWLQAGCDSSHSYWLADCSEKDFPNQVGPKGLSTNYHFSYKSTISFATVTAYKERRAERMTFSMRSEQRSAYKNVGQCGRKLCIF